MKLTEHDKIGQVKLNDYFPVKQIILLTIAPVIDDYE